MSIATWSFGSGFAVAPWIDRGLSEEAVTLRSLIAAASDFSRSIAVGEPKRAAVETLDAVYAAAQVDNWDEMGSAAVEPSTYLYAREFLSLLPSTAPMPEVSVDRDGEISFEWDYGPRQVFSVSVGRDGTLTYAGLFGYSKTHGVEHLREALPVAISHNLERVAASAPR